MDMDRKLAVLTMLKIRGHAGLAEAADHLGVTKQGALRHLEALERAGLVEVHAQGRGGPGRPAGVYRLTESAALSFPSRHRELAAELVDFMEQDQLDRFFAARTARIEAEYAPRLAGLDLAARVRELARLASEQGHMTEVLEDADGTLSLRHCNCPIQDVAARGGHPCRHERSMYERLLGADVTRSEWVGSGGAACSYAITSNPGNPDNSGEG